MRPMTHRLALTLRILCLIAMKLTQNAKIIINSMSKIFEDNLFLISSRPKNNSLYIFLIVYFIL